MEKSLVFAPNDASLYINIGIVKECAGNRDEAEIYYRKALKLEPANQKAKHLLDRLIHSSEQDC